MKLQCLSVCLLASMVISGCATLPGGHLWGEDATLKPGWSRVRSSAIDAARDPWVWAPLIGAAAFQVDDLDRRTSDWAREHTPVFGSQRSAENWSDDLRTASSIAHYLTIAATPGGADPSEWMISKSKATLVQMAGVAVTGATTRVIKTSTHRERPNGQTDESFPSGHTSASAVHTRFAMENLESIDLTPAARCSLDVGLTMLTIGTSWARIEAGWHFPSDTLFSMALGNFIGSFVSDAFLGLEDPEHAVTLAPTTDGLVVSWNWRF